MLTPEMRVEMAEAMAVSNTEGFKKVGAEETKHATGAQRDTRMGKGAFHWMPQSALFLVSRIYENGNRQRGIRNWEKGMPISEYIDSAQRHLAKYLAGFRDEPHLCMAAWNILGALQTSIWIRMGLRPKELNDLPDHITGREMGEIDPLAPMEIEWLKAWGITINESGSTTESAKLGVGSSS
jgi:hypothetical protein